MMLTIHGFPTSTKYQDVKLLIKGECNISDFILDNLLNDNEGSKKVRVGLADNAEGYKVMKCLDGYRIQGNHVLKVVPVGKTAPAPPQPNSYDPRSGYSNTPRNEFSNQSRNDYISINPSNDYVNKVPHGHPGPHSQGAPVAPVGSRYYSLGDSYGQGTSGPPRGQHGQPSAQDSMGRPSPWASSGNSTNQWSDNQPMAAQIPQNTFSYNSQPQNVNSSFVPQQHQPNPGPSRPDVRGFNQDRSAPGPAGFQPKNMAPVPPTRPTDSRSRALRSIETVEMGGGHPPDHGRYPGNQPFQQDKPLTIKKDNFQGPTVYNINNPGHTGIHPGDVGRSPPYQSQATPSPWQSQGQQPKQQFPKSSPLPYDKQYDDRKYIDSDNRDPKMQGPRSDPAPDRAYKDYDKRRGFSPRRSPHRRRGSADRRISPSGRRLSPSRVSPARRGSPPGKRVSPLGRRVSPPGRRVSPPGRRVSPPGRRVSPSARRVSPNGRRIMSPGRRISPSGRRPVSPRRRGSPDRRMQGNHPGRRPSPHKRMSPNRRLVSPRTSPGRRNSPHRQPARYSPEHSDKYGQDKLKHVRPAYEPSAHAQIQAKYSGGYRPNVHESVQYPMQGVRQVEQRSSPWQREADDAPSSMKQEDDRPRMPIGRRQMSDLPVDTPRNHSPPRKSRSPLRHDRGSYRDNYKRISPSTHSSRSPSRSWAVEKRRSPEIRDAPPPPSWPEQNLRDNDYSRPSRSNFPDRDQNIKDKNVPVWERPIEKDMDPRVRRIENHERRSFNDEKIRAAKVLAERDLLPHPSHLDKQREPKFATREYPDTERRDNYRRRDESPDRKINLHREDYESARRPRDHEERQHLDDMRRRREPSPRHDSRKDDIPNPNMDKDFEDIYNRALQFKKKAEELRRLGSKKRDDFLEDEVSRSHHSEREREDNRSQRYDDRHRYPEDDQLRQREDRRDVRPRLEPRSDDAQRRDFRREDGPQPSDRDRNARLNIRAKREKAVEEITSKIINRYEYYRNMKGEQKTRVQEELSLAIGRIIHDMFGDNDVSFIEIIIKYQAKYREKDEQKILQDVMASLPSQFRSIKRKASEPTETLSKTARRSQSPQLKQERPSSSALKQRPAPTAAKKPAVSKPVAKYEQSKSAKSEPLKQEVVKGANKTSEALDATPNETTRNKTEVKKTEEENNPANPATSEASSGRYELNERMTRMVETELRDIMIKVWQELPDNPSDEVERIVVDKLRNKLSDNLRNVLGLNITKRLLNIHNPLYVKVKFSGKPEKVYLGEFLKKYNFIAFKRIEKTDNMFAAQVKTINDFDKVCGEREVKCGNIKVFINPMYRFTKCPPNLVSSFYDEETETSDDANTETIENVAKSDKQVVAKGLTKDSENTPKTKEAVKAETNAKSNEVAKVINKTDKNNTSDKPTNDNKVVNKPANDNKSVAETKTANDKTTVKTVTEGKANVEQKTNAQKANNEQADKVQTAADKAPIENKNAKPVGSKAPVKKEVNTPIKTANEPKTSDKGNKSQVYNDYDELDDNDILALMSEGIVVDEWSETDD
ncbi:muscle M-line assembly protein unc-89-like isoform X7 [Trichoplusia ni]|uniref:Muscle M-line assembly protein unc-89-like isoform X7 n=1 Tax=Trichoplusia ni TaxID=7111 RepID=A0A7E5WS96_TRINI|nr:muscle M-line assembly protein unc-89-like isoform X7 [Trichoplusia ni]